MSLKLDGKPFVKEKLTPEAQRIMDFLNKAGDNEIFSRQELITRGFSIQVLARNHDIWKKVSRIWQQRRYYGNPKAMAAFDKEVGQ